MARSDRTGRRKSREDFRTRVPDLGYYFIVTDAKETEENYLYGLRDSLPKELRGRIIIKVSRARTQKLVETCKEQAALEPQYGLPWIVFDRDRVTNFDEIISKAQKEGVSVGWSNPCIEIWFDAYFGKMHSYIDSVVCCRKFAETYEQRTGQEYHKDNPQIYTMLNRFGNERQAIQIAEKRFQWYSQGNEKRPSEMCPCSTLYELIKEVKEKVENSTVLPNTDSL